MGLIDSFINNVNIVANFVWVPAILVGAILSVLMADMHREIKHTLSFFEKKLNNIGWFFDRILELIIAFFYAVLVTGFIIFIGIIAYTLLNKIVSFLSNIL